MEPGNLVVAVSIRAARKIGSVPHGNYHISGLHCEVWSLAVEVCLCKLAEVSSPEIRWSVTYRGGVDSTRVSPQIGPQPFYITVTLK